MVFVMTTAIDMKTMIMKPKKVDKHIKKDHEIPTAVSTKTRTTTTTYGINDDYSDSKAIFQIVLTGIYVQNGTLVFLGLTVLSWKVQGGLTAVFPNLKLFKIILFICMNQNPKIKRSSQFKGYGKVNC
jgi:hypothetical protein